MFDRSRYTPRRVAITCAVAVVGGLATYASGAPAASSTRAAVSGAPAGSPPTCNGAPFHALDFWIGAWQVFDADTSRLVAFDRVDKRAAGCIIEEHLHFLTDLYRRPGVSRRLAGISISRFDGERWLQMWADNQWGAIALRSVAINPDKLVFETVIPSRGRDVRLVYQRLPDGEARIRQYVAPTGSGRWTQYGNLLYRPNR